MISIISPAKTLDFDSSLTIGNSTRPYFLEDAEKINKKLKSLSRKKLAQLQSVSPNLASLNYARNQEWNLEHEEQVRQAALCFNGDVYLGLQASDWLAADMHFAEDHLRILSGLYGILKPTDTIMPYRLEMGTSLSVGRRKDLYHFWNDRIKAYFKVFVAKDETIVNLASNEYFKAIKVAKVPNPVLDVEFKDYSNGQYKVVSFYAKKARGLMANYLIQNRIDNSEQIKSFNLESYYFDEKSSSANKFVFLRDHR